MLPLRASILLLTAATLAGASEAQMWQPVIDYSISFPGDRPDAAPLINPFENFTHLSSDFGWMGPGEARIDAKAGIIRVKGDGGDWTGAWHSLAGLAVEKNRTLDPRALIGLGGPPEKITQLREIAVNTSGHGSFRLELIDANQKIVWRESRTLNSNVTQTLRFPIPEEFTERVKFLNWVAERDCDLQMSSIGFLVEPPKMSLEEWAFRISLGKIRRCHDPASGLTRDRGHLPAGKFDSIPATGMHALASALGAKEGMLDRNQVVAEIQTSWSALCRLQNAYGFLPHFVHRDSSGRIVIVPSTEFSTIDTTLALHGMLLATRVLEMDDLNREIEDYIQRMNFDIATDADGWISHGFHDDAQTRLQPSWRDWGGETALVLAMEAMIPNRTPRGKMTPSGEPYRGCGFIAEIQSLFYPDFDSPKPDLVTGMSWPKIRRELLDKQMTYFKSYWPQSKAAMTGIFGISAGETGMPGAGYSANGVEVMNVRWLYPHYMIMGLGLNDSDLYHNGLTALYKRQFLYPFGLPENIEADLQLHNPMQGGLNASFEALASYHGWKKRMTADNALDQAAMAEPLMRSGAKRFYTP